MERLYLFITLLLEAELLKNGCSMSHATWIGRKWIFGALSTHTEQLFSSENCAAASWAKALLDRVLQDGAPGVHDTEDVLSLRVVGGSDDVTFLASDFVDYYDSSADSVLGLFRTNDLHGVKAASGQGLSSESLGQSQGLRTSSMGDDRANLARVVGVHLLVERNADQLVWRNKSVEPLEYLPCESLPVPITAVDEGRKRRTNGGSVHSVPDGLAASTADILGCTRDANGRNLTTHSLKLVGGLELSFPGLLGVERVKLDVVQGHGLFLNRVLSVEQGQDVVALLDISFVGCDGDDLVSPQFLVADPGL